MSKDDKDATDAPKTKSKKKLMIIIAIAVVVLGGGGAGAYLKFFAHKSDVKPEPVKGAVVAISEAITINLAESHYLKLGFAMQMTEEAGETEVDTAEALDLAIDHYTGMKIGELETEKGRETAKAELLEKIEHAYTVDKKELVMGIYFTQFVTQ